MTWTDLPNDIASYLRNVHAKNVGEKDAVLYFNSIPYIIRAGQSTTLPFEAACVWLGDPRAGERAQVIPMNGETTWIPSRNDEITRLRQLYGMHALGSAVELVAGTDPETKDEIDYPRIELTSSNGDRLYTVLEDPTGELANGSSLNPHVAQHQENQSEIISRLERELAMLKERAVREDAGLVADHHHYEPMSESELPRDEAPDPSAPLPPGPTDNLQLPVEEKKPRGWRAKD